MQSPSTPAWNHSTPQKFGFQLLCLVGALTLAGRLAVEAVDGIGTTGGAIAVALAGFVGLLLADLASGLVHWAADTYGTERTPLVGQLFVKLFRVHHSDPDNITRTGFVRINGDNSMLAAVFMLGMLGLRVVGVGPTSPWAVAMLVTFSVAIAFTNLLHQWAHRTDPPLLGRALHRLELVLTPGAHARHHQAPHLTDYCITFGWMNPVLDRVDMFRRMERGLAALGVHPTRDASDVLPASASSQAGSQALVGPDHSPGSGVWRRSRPETR